MTDRIRILFIVPMLDLGGSEKVILHLVSNIDRRKFDVSLIVLKKQGSLIAQLPTDINIIFFNFSRTVLAVPSIILAVWRIRPQILFTTLGHLNLLIALFRLFLPSRVVLCARESSIVSKRNADERYPKLFNFLFRTVYKRFNIIICQSAFMKKDLAGNFGIDENKMVVINNPVDFKYFNGSATSSRPGDSIARLLSVGSLRREKGYERLINALCKCPVSYEYRIVGGGDPSKLEQQIAELHLQDRIKLLGQKENPIPYYYDSDCLLVGSYYEGFPNAVIEANACGVPVIAFSAPGGHNEIIVEGVNGWFVNNENELIDLIASKAYNKLHKTEIITLTKERYELSKIIAQYQAVLESAVKTFGA